jgi:hypothetical protein
MNADPRPTGNSFETRLGGRTMQTIVRPSRHLKIAASQAWWAVAGTYIVDGIRHILLGADHLLVGCFVVFHGHAHGTELPPGQGPRCPRHSGVSGRFDCSVVTKVTPRERLGFKAETARG